MTGDGTFAVDAVVTPARTLTPSATLAYSSAAGNGPFGMGFSLAPASVSRRTGAGVPAYRATDTFDLAGVGALTPALRHDPKTGAWTPVVRTASEAGEPYRVTTFRPRLEADLPLVEQWERAGDGLIHWVVTTADGTVERYGISVDGRVADPERPDERVATWLLQERTDTKGNRAVYTYLREDDAGATAAFEGGHAQTAQRYPAAVRYGNYVDDAGAEQFSLELVFDYGERDLDHLDQPGADPYAPVRPWPRRADPFSSYAAGFEVRTARLCRAVLMFHHFPDELGATPCLTSSLRCAYDETPALSRLVRVVRAGHRRRTDGSYASAALPPLDVTWSAFDPPPAPRFRTLRVTGGGTPTGELQRGDLQPVDLHGEGLTGLLYSDDVTTYYYAPEGDGTYARPAAPRAFPNVRDLRDPRLSLEDLDGDGQLELVVDTPTKKGYFPRDEDGGWRTFTPFRRVPTMLGAPDGELVDLDGSGRSDLLRVHGRTLVAYPSRGGEGYGTEQVARRPPGFPASPRQSGGRQLVTFAGVFGDGLAHRVRVADGEVEVWPSLGHGRFGAPVRLEGAPAFAPDTTPDRIFFADVDGSGTADLVLAYGDRLNIHLNQAGNGFAPAIAIPLPMQLGALGRIAFADVLGTGTTAVVATSATPGLEHWFCDLTGGVKPYLVTGVDDHVGLTAELEYAPSTRFALEDRRAGRPWTTRLPFPVHVVAKVTLVDAVAGTRLARRHRYRDGWFDPVQREFRGFGFVESWDAESFDELAAAARVDERLAAPRAEIHAAPVRTRSWFQVGSLRQADALRRARGREQFDGDPDAYIMPASVLDEAARAAGAPTLDEAYTALTGRVLRTEVYADDGSPVAAVPYTVTDTNYTVRMVQPARDGARGVFHVQARETVDADYERRSDDPRVTHAFGIEDTLVDDDGATTTRQRTITINYPRRGGAAGPTRVPEQGVALATLSETVRTRVLAPFRMVGAPVQQRALDLGGLHVAPGAHLTFSAAATFATAALAAPIDYGTPFGGTVPQSRAAALSRSFYWDETQTAALPLGSITARALLHHGAEAAFPPSWATAVYGELVTAADLTAAGYVLDDATATWWSPGLVATYHRPDEPSHYFLLAETGRPDEGAGPFSQTTVAYDAPYRLRPVGLTTAVDAATALTSAALLDHQALRPWQLTDPNGVVTQALPDPLGGVIATSTFRPATATAPRVGDGDLGAYVVRDGATFADVLDDPLTYLQDAGAFFLTDLHAVTAADPRPLTTVALQRPRYASDGPATADELAMRITLWDGTGRAAAQLAACGADERGGPDGESGAPPALWRVSGRIVYDNKGRPVEEYLSTWSTEPGPVGWRAGGPTPAVGAPPPEVTRYDPLGRPVRVDTPKGFFTKVELTPWEERRYDADDTVLESRYYRDFLARLPPLPTPDEQAELDALEQAAEAYNTPSIAVLDPAARAVRHIRDNLGAVPAERLEPIVQGTAITARQLWDELVDQGYLATSAVAPIGTWLTDRFDPYAPGFELRLDPPYDQLADATTAFLLEGRITDLRVLDERGRALRLVDPRLFLAEVRTATPRTSLRCAYPMGASEPARTDSADAGTRWTLDDVAGNAVLAVDGRDLRTVRAFDGLRRPVTATVSAGTAPPALRERFTYGEGRPDAAAHGLIGRLWRVEDGAGVVTTPDYGIDGQPRTTVRRFTADAAIEPDWSQPVALAPEEYATGTTFDAIGALVAETPPGGATVRWTYYRSGKLSAVTVDPPEGGATVTVASALRYDAAGQRTAVTFGNGVTQASGYELTTGRLLTLQAARADGTLVQAIAYTCDPVGNVTRVRDATAGHAYCAVQPEGRSNLSYDPLYRLRSATGLQLPGLAADTYATGFKQTVFAPLCASGDDPPSVLEAYSESYDYDLAGNLVALAHRAPSGDWDRAMPVADGSNRLADGAYDAIGNTLSIQLAAPVGLTWDDHGMLASAVAPAASTTYYNYDAARNRARRRVDAADGSWAERRYLGFCLLDLDDAEATQTTLRVGDGAGTFATLSGDSAQPLVRWELDDRLGSVGLQLDDAGAVVSYEAFLPYGGSSAISAADEAVVAPKSFRFSGKETDDSTALTYYGARYAMPWLGRWLSPDPAGPVDGLNLYAYVNGNPLTLVDRDGSCGSDPSRPPQQPPTWRSLYATFQQEAFNQFVNAPRRFFMGVGAIGMFPFYPQLRQQRRDYFIERRHLIREAGTGLGIAGFIPALVWQHFDAGTRPWAMRPGANGDSPIQIAGRQINRNNYVAGYAGGWVGQWLSVSTALSFAWTYRTWGQSVSWPRYFRGWAGVSVASFLIMREGRAAQARQDHAMVQRRLAQHDPQLPEAYNQLGELTGLPQSAALFYGETERARPFADISPWAFGALFFGVVGARVFVGFAARRAIPRALMVIQPRETALVVWRPPVASQTPKTPTSK